MKERQKSVRCFIQNPGKKFLPVHVHEEPTHSPGSVERNLPVSLLNKVGFSKHLHIQKNLEIPVFPLILAKMQKSLWSLGQS